LVNIFLHTYTTTIKLAHNFSANFANFSAIFPSILHNISFFSHNFLGEGTNCRTRCCLSFPWCKNPDHEYCMHAAWVLGLAHGLATQYQDL